MFLVPLEFLIISMHIIPSHVNFSRVNVRARARGFVPTTFGLACSFLTIPPTHHMWLIGRFFSFEVTVEDHLVPVHNTTQNKYLLLLWCGVMTSIKRLGHFSTWSRHQPVLKNDFKYRVVLYCRCVLPSGSPRGIPRKWLWVGTRRDQNAMVQGTQGFRQVQAAGA